MKIAREEIFGPVLSIMPYDSEDEAIDIANDTPFGLAGFCSRGISATLALSPNACAPGGVHQRRALRPQPPFGGYKQSGNGREFGVFGFEEYLEVKAILGH